MLWTETNFSPLSNLTPWLDSYIIHGWFGLPVLITKLCLCILPPLHIFTLSSLYLITLCEDSLENMFYRIPVTNWGVCNRHFKLQKAYLAYFQYKEEWFHRHWKFFEDNRVLWSSLCRVLELSVDIFMSWLINRR